MQKQLHAKPTQLYRHFDADGALLYVGISLRAIKRLKEHSRNSDWFNDIARVDIEHFSDRQSAIDAERKAVQEEKPKYNKQLTKCKPENQKVEVSKDNIIYRLVSVCPLHTLDETSSILGIRIGLVREIIESGRLSVVEMPPHRKGGKPKQMITGWGILTYIEMLEQDAKERSYAVQKQT